MNRSFPLSVAAGLVAVAAVVAAPSSRAETQDFKFVAPVDCEPYAPDTLAHELVITPTGIYNPGNSVERVLCPMPRDQDDPFLSGDVQVTVYYRGMGPASSRVTCTLFVGSTSMQSTAITTASAAGVGVSNGARGDVSINGTIQTDEFNTVPVNVICALTPRVSLAGLFWSEAGPTNTP
jgi:hypothetical protein